MAAPEVVELALREVLLPAVASALHRFHLRTVEEAGVYINQRFGDSDSLFSQFLHPRCYERHLNRAWKAVFAQAGDAATPLASPASFPVVSVEQLHCACDTGGFPTLRRGLLAVLRGLVRRKKKEEEYPDLCFIECFAAHMTDPYLLRIRGFEAEGRSLVLAARLCCISRSFRDAVNAWQPPAERKARLYRLALARQIVEGQALQREMEQMGDFAEVRLEPYVRLVDPPPRPKLGERGELEAMEAALTADERCRW